MSQLYGGMLVFLVEGLATGLVRKSPEGKEIGTGLPFWVGDLHSNCLK